MAYGYDHRKYCSTIVTSLTASDVIAMTEE